ncbi:hypothetical protein DL93DRAFT_2073569 [Clavulina sp. PMI_390]|nr:hypothetical protein DL93DRAFT_2073569 [Clavulina sp. PMI_390]
MAVDEIVSSNVGRGVRDMVWAEEKSSILLALNARAGGDGFLEQWDISQAEPRVSGSLKVDDSDMQFLLHDWRVPRAVERFGYDNSRDTPAYLRGIDYPAFAAQSVLRIYSFQGMCTTIFSRGGTRMEPYGCGTLGIPTSINRCCSFASSSATLLTNRSPADFGFTR